MDRMEVHAGWNVIQDEYRKDKRSLRFGNEQDRVP